MATQAEVAQFLKSNYQCEEIGENIFQFMFTFTDGRSQIVHVGILEDSMRVTSPFASRDDLNLNQAFNASRGALFGLSTTGNYWVLTNTVPIADIDPSEIQWCLQEVSASADNIEESSTGVDQY